MLKITKTRTGEVKRVRRISELTDKNVFYRVEGYGDKLFRLDIDVFNGVRGLEEQQPQKIVIKD